mmetsp:Transcript_41654/g.75605  ORF Transcript_41654/g.75605 Transcript_41654/m.75605 type:complete len:423 (-) Transcript_41654:37-1305(-)
MPDRRPSRRLSIEKVVIKDVSSTSHLPVAPTGTNAGWWRKSHALRNAEIEERVGPVYIFDHVTGEKHSPFTHLDVSVGHFKELISNLVKVAPHQLRLSLGGHVLQDGRTLRQHGVEHGYCLHALPSSAAGEALRTSRRAGVGEASDTVDSTRRFPVLQPAAPDCRFMQLTVCCVDDSPRPMLHRLRVYAQMEDTILQLKRQIEAQTGVGIGFQRIAVVGRTLNNDMTVRKCGIRDDSVVLQLQLLGGSHWAPVDLERNTKFALPACCVERDVQPLTVRELWPDGKSHRIFFGADNTIANLKEQVEHLTGVARSLQMLMHQGRVLRDEQTCGFYNLSAGAQIDLARASMSPRAQPASRHTVDLRGDSEPVACKWTQRQRRGARHVEAAERLRNEVPSPRNAEGVHGKTEAGDTVADMLKWLAV